MTTDPTHWRDHGVRIVRHDQLDANTPQTPGMQRAAAITDNSEDLIMSLIIGGAGFSVLLVFLLALTSSDEERSEEAEVLERVLRRTESRGLGPR